jgi:gamma-glutamylcyclotransferase (GGCT)/AIG2-like uncharacterized protein YtfP
MKTHIVFVYGSLRKGEENRYIVNRHLIRELGDGRIHAVMYDLGEYPAIVLSNDTSRLGRAPAGEIVYGEWLEVSDAGLSELDELEEYPDVYHRSLVKDFDRAVEGWVYHMSGRIPGGAKRIPTGDWTTWRKQRDGRDG